ncbi:hypothetical protein JCM3766R1_000653 [Sporobolomyces carnicolor]
MSASLEAAPRAASDQHAANLSTAEPSTSTSAAVSESLPPSNSSAPVRPPKAAKRPSTASLTNGVPAAAAGEEGAPSALGAPASPSAGSEARSSTTNMDDASKGVALATSTGLREEEKTATAASTMAESSETASSKPVSSQKPSTSTASAAANTTTTTRSAPTTSTSKSASNAKVAKKKRKGPFAFLFACVPCISDPGHDDHPGPSNSNAQKPATGTGTPASPSATKRENEKTARAEPVSQATETPVNEKVASPLAPAVPSPDSVEPTNAITPPATEPLSASTPVATPPPSSSPTPQGVNLPREETEGVTSGAVVPPGQATLVASPPTAAPKSRRRKSGKHPQGGTDGIITSVPEPGARQGGVILAGASGDASDTSEDGSEDGDEEDYLEEEEEDEEQSLIARGGVGIPIGEDGLPHPLLDELSPDLKGRKCLVLDLDETLVHSSFKMVHQADYVVPVEIENQFHNVYVIKRPGVDGFLKAMGEIYEVVVFTASLSKYADPVLDQLDIHRVVKHRLFRESCYNNKGNYVKDLSQLGRPIDECIIIDNSPASYVFHVNNAVPISSWFNDPHDTELTDLVPFLTDLSTVDDVRSVLDAGLYQHLSQAQENGTDDVFNKI